MAVCDYWLQGGSELIIRTGYSFRTAAGHIEDTMSRIKDIGWSVAPVSDRASTFGHVKWSKLAEKEGLRPVFGIELAVTASRNEKRPIFDHWAFFAIDNVRMIHELLELATTQFRYEPLLTYEQALKAKGVIKIAGPRALLDHMKPQKDLYLPMSPSAPAGLIRDGIKRKFEFIATSDNRYPRGKDFPFYELVIGRNASSQTYPQHILDQKEWDAAIAAKGVAAKDRGAAVANREKALGRATAGLPTGALYSPEKPKSLRQLAFEGAARLGIDLSSRNPVYVARLDRELALIADKKFEDYFFIIADVCQWARKRMMVGPARGSSCGSLVCYLLEITTVDPIPYGLIFERFIDINRQDLPDIDIDFSDQQRHLVFEYMAGKYGADHVARLGTVNVFKPRSALHEAGAAFSIPRFRLEQFADTIIHRFSGDSRALQSMEDTFRDTPIGRQLVKDFPEVVLAAGMEGHPNHHGQHAAGLILTQEPVRHFTAIDARTGSTHCDKKDAEDLNLLKIDALGLTQLSVFEDALELAGLDRNHLFGLKLNDANAFRVLNSGHFAGIFQFNGQALQQIARSVTVDDIEDIIAITALARPGPMASGGTSTWIQRRKGETKVQYAHPLFTPHLERTLGVVVYQEQVMTIGRDIGDLSWEDVTLMRKAMSKTLGKEYFDQFGDRWKAGARKKGITDEKVLTKIWDDLCAYGSWAFNRSHSVAYGIISYWCCWLKAHHPVEFAAATLTHESDSTKQLLLLRELHREGVAYIPVDADLSTDKWTVAKKKGKKYLIGPVTNVVGIGPKAVQTIMSARSRKEPIPTKIQKLLAGGETDLSTLWPITEAIERIMPDPSKRNIHSPNTPLSEARKLEDEAVMSFVLIDRIVPRDENEEVRVANRKGKRIEDGKTAYLVLYMRDDTDSMMGRISRYDFEEFGRPIVERGGAGKVLYAVKGVIPPGFNMMMIKQARYIGDM